MTTYAPSLSNMSIGVSSSQNSRILQNVQLALVRIIHPSKSSHLQSTTPDFNLHCTSLEKHNRHGRTHNCLHIPHGLAGGEISVATATALNFLCPSVTAFPNATRSAQVPTGYAAFSTFAPSIYWSSCVRIEAPTRNRE